MCDDPATPLRVLIRSIGCRTNQEEMTALQFEFQEKGIRIVCSVEDADVIIVNTCSVTSCSESKTRRFLKAISSGAPEARILVTGCLAQQKPFELSSIGGVHWVVGNTFKHLIPVIVQEEDGGIFHGAFKDKTESFRDFRPVIPSAKSGSRTRFPVKIQEGCDYRCAYCIVPFLRGPSRSASEDDILKTLKTAIDSGYKELVLTGTHIGQYSGKQSLAGLINKILNIGGDFRVRLSSLDPRDLTDELLELIGKEPRVCDHLHISFQSLDETVLKLMDRPYKDFDRLLGTVVEFRKAFPRAGLGADLIVGYPGESECMFDIMLQRAALIGFSYAHVFRYSPRPGTRAALSGEKISETIKSERSLALRRVISESRSNFLRSNEGIRCRIIVESEFPVRGLTSNYLHVEVPSIRVERNSWLYVELKNREQGRYCIAEPVNP